MEHALAKILVCAEGAWSTLNFLHGKGSNLTEN